jgi:rSAM/selenodomain-associated transferase 1
VTRVVRRTSASRPVIIVFAREPIAGFTKTRLIPRLGAANAAVLAHAFTLDALAKAQRTGLPVVIAGSAPSGIEASRYFQPLAKSFDAILIDQGEGSLGARMSRSLARFHDRGALLIGTDTPSLPPRFIARAVTLMRKWPIVLGPSLDGGYYLVALRRKSSISSADIFRGIRWGGSRVLAATIDRLERAEMRYALAPAWYDIDRWSDLLLLAAHLRIILRVEANPCPHTSRILVRLGLL